MTACNRYSNPLAVRLALARLQYVSLVSNLAALRTILLDYVEFGLFSVYKRLKINKLKTTPLSNSPKKQGNIEGFCFKNQYGRLSGFWRVSKIAVITSVEPSNR